MGEAARVCGVSISTLRGRDGAGTLKSEQTPGGHRRYDLSKLRPDEFRASCDTVRRTIACARVSSHDQKDNLERQALREGFGERGCHTPFRPAIRSG